VGSTPTPGTTFCVLFSLLVQASARLAAASRSIAIARSVFLPSAFCEFDRFSRQPQQCRGSTLAGDVSRRRNLTSEGEGVGARSAHGDAHRRRFDVVVVWKFDRLPRSGSHLPRALETFGSLGIEFVSLPAQMDTSTPTGKMVFTVLGAAAELDAA
jgi:hypothetical protein